MKNKIENSIKEQLNQREIPVSENAWDKLAQMMDEEVISTPKEVVKPNSNTRKLGIYLTIAASFAILIGLFWGKFFPAADALIGSQTSTQIVSKEKDLKILQKSNQNPVTELAKNEEFYYVDNSVTTIAQNTKAPQETKAVTKQETIKESNPTKEVIPENKIISEEIKRVEEPQSEIALQKEEVPPTPKKSGYVDPEMLLYSIENNEAVKQSNSTSRIVLVDFNK